MKSTIKDVAKLAQVSISTVSRVLNNPEQVVPEKRQRVLEAVEQLKYRPNALARGLIHKRTQTLGVLISDISKLFYPEVIRGMEDAAHESGNNLIICNTDNDKDRTYSYLRMLYEKQVDGIIFTSEPISQDYYQLFQELGIPVVLAATHSLEYEIPSVKIDEEQASYDATEYLIRQGHRNIGILSGPMENVISGLPRLQGYMRAMRNYSVDFDSNRSVEFCTYRFEDGYEAMSRLLAKFPEVTAVFASSDERAIGAISYLHQQGIKVPDQISIIGFDNIKVASMCIPKLTTVCHPLYLMGQQAVKKLEELITQGTVKELRTYLPHQIIERESVRSLL